MDTGSTSGDLTITSARSGSLRSIRIVSSDESPRHRCLRLLRQSYGPSPRLAFGRAAGNIRAAPFSPLRTDNGAIPVKADLMDRDQVSRVVSDVAPDNGNRPCRPESGFPSGSSRGERHRCRAPSGRGSQQGPRCPVLVIGSSAEYGYAGEQFHPRDSATSPREPIRNQ